MSLEIQPLLCDSTNPFASVEWETRDAVILGEGGETVFQQNGIAVPKDWSQTALNIVSSKYFYGEQGTDERETSIQDMIQRVTRTITNWGIEDGYFDKENGEVFYRELTWLCLNQHFAFNSPVWFNVGIWQQYGVTGTPCGFTWTDGEILPVQNPYEEPQCAACQPYHALVATEEGLIPIGEIVSRNRVGLRVFDGDGLTPITAVKANGKKAVFKIHLRGGFEVEATSDHLVCATKTRGQKKQQWHRVDALQLGMFMHLYPHVTNNPLVACSSQQMISEAALVGWLQTDGYVGQPGLASSLIMEFVTVNQEEFDWVIYHLGQIFPHVHRRIEFEPTEDEKVDFHRIRLYGEVLRPFVDKYNLGVRNPCMEVPPLIMSAPDDIIVAYLRSVFQADGYVVKSGLKIGIQKVSQKMMHGVHLLLARLGIYSRLSYKPDRRKGRLPSWLLMISIQSEREQFAARIGFIAKYKQQRVQCGIAYGQTHDGKVCPDLRLAKIESIEYMGCQDVYDIQTESGQYLSQFVLVHNCFIQSVQDNMEDIMRFAVDEAMLFKFGSGVGADLSTLRGSCEKLSGGGNPSGPLSFARIYNEVAEVVKSGGKTRRAALLFSLKDTHPDLMKFIQCKAHEEDKAATLVAKGYDPQDAYMSVLYQNANLSVRLTDEFMLQLAKGGDWYTRWVTDSAVSGPKHKAADVLHAIAEAAWRCGDPGVQFDTTLNKWHTCPKSGRISASNPCGEFNFLDDSACNLASLNLMKFRRADGTLDVFKFQSAVRIGLIAMDIMVDRASYPSAKIAQNTHRHRPLGLGYSNLGSFIMSSGVAYDSDLGRSICAGITSLLTGTAYYTSADIAETKGAFEDFESNRSPMLEVMSKHYAALGQTPMPVYLAEASHSIWKHAGTHGELHGYRNAQTTVLAPTGTISFMMDCSTLGIEPDIALMKYKKLVGGGLLKMVNKSVPKALRFLGYTADDIDSLMAWVEEKGTFEGSSLSKDHLSVFDTALAAPGCKRVIPWEAHLNMLAAAQPFISGAISKTVNMPADSTVQDIEEAIIRAWKLGLKSLTVYRDGSKAHQPLNTSLDDEKRGSKDSPPEQIRRSLPNERKSITKKFSISGHDGYVTVGMYPDGSAGELFISMSKEGSTISGMMDAFSIAVSLGLQHGVPMETFVDKFSYMQFEPMGWTKDEDIKNAKSIIDFIFRWMQIRFKTSEKPALEQTDQTDQTDQEATPICDRCGSMTVRNGSCYLCYNCGTSSGCS